MSRRIRRPSRRDVLKYGAGAMAASVFQRPASAEQVRINLPVRTRAAGGGGAEGLLPAFTWPDDFTYLGCYRVPAPSAGGAADGMGLALRREPDDSNQVHLLSAALAADDSGGYMGHLWEWRDATPTNPGSPLVSANYGAATKLKDYGNPYGTGAGCKRKVWYLGSYVNWLNAGLTPHGGLYAEGSRVYISSTFTYQDVNKEAECKALTYADLNYGAGTLTPAGAWRFSSWMFKSTTNGCLKIPDAVLSAMGLGTKRLGVMGGGYSSLASAGDCSFGPTLSAWDPDTIPAEEGTITATKLVGFAPHPSNGTPDSTHKRPNRPAGYDYIRPGLASESDDTFAVSQWSQIDHTRGGVWIHGANKAGFLAVCNIQTGMDWYVSGTHGSDGARNFMAVIAEEDMADVALGMANAYDVPVTMSALEFAAVDYSKYTLGTAGSGIASITSVMGDGEDAAGTGALVTTNAAHGLSNGEVVSIHGSGVDEYNNGWVVSVVDATSFRIYDGNHVGKTWNGTTAGTGTVNTCGWGGGLVTAARRGIHIQGLAYDDETGKLYMLFVNQELVQMIAMWQFDD